MIPVEIENVRLNLALSIPTGARIAVANDAPEMLPVVIDIYKIYLICLIISSF